MKSSKPESIERERYSKADALEQLIKIDRQRKDAKTGASKHIEIYQHMHTNT